VSRWLYTAQFAPLDKPVSIPDQNGRPIHTVYREDTFALQAKRPSDIKVCLQHDRSMEIGKLGSLIAHRGWWLADFTVDVEGIEFEVGDPVSAGSYVFDNGSGNPIMRELSIVTRARIDDAKIIRKNRLPDLPARRGVPPSPPAAAGEIVASIPQGRVRRRHTELDELHRRLDSAGPNADFELILEAYRNELGYPSSVRWAGVR
jgi:hypothetical protein